MAYYSIHTGQEIDEAVVKVSQLLDLFYPVGSIYTSTKNTNPAATLGGTWTQIKDRFLLCAGDSYSAGATGGSATHAHTSAAHTHTSAAHSHDGGSLSPQLYIGVSGLIYDWGSPSVSRTFTPKWKTLFSGASDVQHTTAQNTAGVPTYGNTGTTTPGNTGSTTPGNTGSSSNLPPYKVVYAWERTA